MLLREFFELMDIMHFARYFKFIRLSRFFITQNTFSEDFVLHVSEIIPLWAL